MNVERWDAQLDGPLSEAALRRKLEGLGYRASRYVYPPGTVFPAHHHDADKLDAVLEGRFRFVVRGEAAVLGPGDAVCVPRGVAHSAEVVGDEPVISFDGIRDPGWP